MVEFFLKKKKIFPVLSAHITIAQWLFMSMTIFYKIRMFPFLIWLEFQLIAMSVASIKKKTVIQSPFFSNFLISTEKKTNQRHVMILLRRQLSRDLISWFTNNQNKKNPEKQIALLLNKKPKKITIFYAISHLTFLLLLLHLLFRFSIPFLSSPFLLLSRVSCVLILRAAWLPHLNVKSLYI